MQRVILYLKRSDVRMTRMLDVSSEQRLDLEASRPARIKSTRLDFTFAMNSRPCWSRGSPQIEAEGRIPIVNLGGGGNPRIGWASQKAMSRKSNQENRKAKSRKSCQEFGRGWEFLNKPRVGEF